jgi:cell division protein FtsL
MLLNLKVKITMDNNPFFRSIHRSTIVIFSIVIGYCLLIEYGSYNHMTMLEDSMAKEIQTKGRLIEDQRRLKVETAALRSPQRIEDFAKDRLQMYYPKKNKKHRKEKGRPFMTEQK